MTKQLSTEVLGFNTRALQSWSMHADCRLQALMSLRHCLSNGRMAGNIIFFSFQSHVQCQGYHYIQLSCFLLSSCGIIFTFQNLRWKSRHQGKIIDQNQENQSLFRPTFFFLFSDVISLSFRARKFLTIIFIIKISYFPWCCVHVTNNWITECNFRGIFLCCESWFLVSTFK